MMENEGVTGMTMDDVLREHGNAEPTQGSGLNERGGCAVDWSWLHGRQVARVTNGLDEVKIEFTDGETFTIRALLWQSKPFLSFEPLRGE